MMSPQHQPCIQVRSKIAIIYNQFIGDRKTKLNPSLNNFIVSDIPTYSGELKEHARKRLARCISLLNQCSPWQRVPSPVTQTIIDFKLSFITLTFPNEKQISGSDGYKNALYPFLRIMKMRYSGFLYVYKAELQERGQLHYHITSNKCIPHEVVRQVWNKVLSEAGYNSEYIAKYGHNAAPSTEIRSVLNIRDIEAYLVKYVSKSDPQGRKIDGKVWGCSQELQGRSYFSEVLNSTNIAAIEALEKAGKAIVKVIDRCTIVKLKEGSPLMLLSKLQYQQYGDFINNILCGIKEEKRKFAKSLDQLGVQVGLAVDKAKVKAQLTLLNVDEFAKGNVSEVKRLQLQYVNAYTRNI